MTSGREAKASTWRQSWKAAVASMGRRSANARELVNGISAPRYGVFGGGVISGTTLRTLSSPISTVPSRSFVSRRVMSSRCWPK